MAGRETREAHFEITGNLDDRNVEALRLEVRALAKRLGLTLEEFRLDSRDRAPSA